MRTVVVGLEVAIVLAIVTEVIGEVDIPMIEDQVVLGLVVVVVHDMIHHHPTMIVVAVVIEIEDDRNIVVVAAVWGISIGQRSMIMSDIVIVVRVERVHLLLHQHPRRYHPIRTIITALSVVVDHDLHHPIDVGIRMRLWTERSVMIIVVVVWVVLAVELAVVVSMTAEVLVVSAVAVVAVITTHVVVLVRRIDIAVVTTTAKHVDTVNAMRKEHRWEDGNYVEWDGRIFRNIHICM